VIHYLLTYGIEGLDEEKLKEMLTTANAAASLITRVKGALRVMPQLADVEALVRTRG
jgi:fructokinase